MLKVKSALRGIAVLGFVTFVGQIVGYESGAAVFTHCLDGVQIFDVIGIIGRGDSIESFNDVGHYFFDA